MARRGQSGDLVAFALVAGAVAWLWMQKRHELAAAQAATKFVQMNPGMLF